MPIFCNRSRTRRSSLVGPLTWTVAAFINTATISCAPHTAPEAQDPHLAATEPGASQSPPGAESSSQTGPSTAPFPRETSGTNPQTSPPVVALRHDRGKTPWLGVELRAPDPGKPGVEIVRVLPGSPAAAAHLQAGDILMRIGDVTATSPTNVSEWVRAQKPGESQPVSVMRNGQPHLVRAKLEGMPEFEDRLRLAFVGKAAPEISGVVTFQGEAASLRELRGQVVVLEFWASFCGVCRFLAPVLSGWQRTYHPQGAQVIGITPDDPQKGIEVARQAGMNYTLASDPDSQVTRDYLASQIPTLLIIDRRGIVHDVIVGYSKARLEEAEKLIEKLLAEPK